MALEIGLFTVYNLVPVGAADTDISHKSLRYPHMFSFPKKKKKKLSARATLSSFKYYEYFQGMFDFVSS